MATPPPPRIFLPGVYGKRGFNAEVGRLRKEEAEQRARATTILDPLDVAGEYDAARLLMTTLGGQIRPITLDDLRQFQHNARKLGKRFKGGITARGVIETSRQEDRDRANSQIRTAVVMSAKAGTLHFVTPSGPDSKVARHHVHVSFPAFAAYAASPNDPKKLAKPMLDGPLRFECDCERFRYWFRFIATKGGFVHGRQEPGYPKIRNPMLTGVACKHALRVMLAIANDVRVRERAAQMIGAAQKNDTRAITTTAQEARAEAQKQLAQQHYVRNRVETMQQQAQRRSGTAAARAKAIQTAAREAQRRAAEENKRGRKALEDAFAKLQAAPLTKAMRDALIAKLQGLKTVD